ncbi:MAG: restriction endonuclease subunit S [Candidatus Thiodiazotropha endolucinida]
MSDVNQVHLEKLESLPEGWAETTVSKIVQMISTNKKKLAQKNYLDKGDFPVVDQGQEFIAGYSNNEALIIHGEPPFIVFGDHTRAFKFANFNFVPGADGVKVMKSLEVDPKWCFYIFQAIKLPNKGYARHFQYLKEAYLPVPPPEQQKRIAAKIEELFSHIDAGIEALKKAKQLLKQYRQSVLKAAVTGELTKEWREANKDKLEPAPQLLERILQERRHKWEEQQLEQFKAKGKLPKDDKWKGKYKEPEYGGDRFFSEIPDEWAIASIDQLAWDVRYGSSSKTNDNEKGVPVLRMGNIVDGQLDYTNLKYLPKNHGEFPELLLEDGDLLFNRTNSAELVGKTAVFRDIGRQASLASYLIRVRVVSGVEPDFVAYFINSSCGRNWIKSCVSQNVGQANVNGTKLKALVMPLPSLEEQKEITRIVEDKMQSSDRLLVELDHQLLKIEKNKLSVLASAFSGKV